jgi:hypothetical protein
MTSATASSSSTRRRSTIRICRRRESLKRGRRQFARKLFNEPGVGSLTDEVGRENRAARGGDRNPKRTTERPRQRADQSADGRAAMPVFRDLLHRQLRQVTGFRAFDKDAYKREDDLYDATMYAALVARVIQNEGWSLFSFMRASSVVNCQSAFA